MQNITKQIVAPFVFLVVASSLHAANNYWARFVK